MRLSNTLVDSNSLLGTVMHYGVEYGPFAIGKNVQNVMGTLYCALPRQPTSRPVTTTPSSHRPICC